MYRVQKFKNFYKWEDSEYVIESAHDFESTLLNKLSLVYETQEIIQEYETLKLNENHMLSPSTIVSQEQNIKTRELLWTMRITNLPENQQIAFNLQGKQKITFLQL